MAQLLTDGCQRICSRQQVTTVACKQNEMASSSRMTFMTLLKSGNTHIRGASAIGTILRVCNSASQSIYKMRPSLKSTASQAVHWRKSAGELIAEQWNSYRTPDEQLQLPPLEMYSNCKHGRISNILSYENWKKS